MRKPSNHRMRAPKGLPLNELTMKWYYQELVIRFGGYKEPIQTVNKLAAAFGLQWYDIVHIVEMDRNGTFLATDRKHVWAVNRCCKI